MSMMCFSGQREVVGSRRFYQDTKVSKLPEIRKGFCNQHYSISIIMANTFIIKSTGIHIREENLVGEEVAKYYITRASKGAIVVVLNNRIGHLS